LTIGGVRPGIYLGIKVLLFGGGLAVFGLHLAFEDGQLTFVCTCLAQGR
jgi:hypothetical protein